ncbi:hypothetical protein [Dermabacter vaginalis]|uniref:hypothetical protein n=1 Tax=Dermabacter vaginalis TaxID=1630135 RepID=UPI001EF4F6E6|nr:hypothetical protein [Dermabacter vaginalis]MCG7443754.1 hypothetical protein [Dermabacter vaginalis]
MGKKRILRDLNLEVRQGNFHGIIGSNGLSETTLFDRLVGFRKAAEFLAKTRGVPFAGNTAADLRNNHHSKGHERSQHDPPQERVVKPQPD